MDMTYVIRYEAGPTPVWHIEADGYTDIALTAQQALELISTREIFDLGKETASMSIRWLDVPDWERVPTADEFEAFAPQHPPLQ
jgi:hypothetical protein